MSICRKVDHHTRVRPDHPALVDGQLRLTYGQLHTLTDALAAQLRQYGVCAESVVAVNVERKIEAAVAMLAIARAGGVYLPLQSDAPQEWKSFVLEDSRACLVFCGTGTDSFATDVYCLQWEWPAEIPATVPDDVATQLDAETAACVVYTSGTTGRPKGVVLTAGPLNDHLDAIFTGFGLRADDRCLQFSPVQADTAIEQVLSVLTLGATVVICDETLSVAEMLKLLARERVTVAHLSTGYWHIIANSLEWRAWPAIPLRQVMVGGDRMSPRAVQLWREKTAIPLLNAYGPTETVITPNVHEVATVHPEFGVPIGDVVGARQLYVLDDALQPVPVEQNGELYLSGLVARGYLGRPGQTAAAFVPDPFSSRRGARMYRTGDVVRRGHDGNLYFIGRADNQTKIRGLRVELGEIDVALNRHPSVHDCAVVAREDRPGDRRLVAYVVPAGSGVDSADLRSYLERSLPDHMVPVTYCVLAALPLTANSKIDRRALRGEQYQPHEAIR